MTAKLPTGLIVPLQLIWNLRRDKYQKLKSASWQTDVKPGLRCCNLLSVELQACEVAQICSTFPQIL